MNIEFSLHESLALEMDNRDPLRPYREEFHFPKYKDGKDAIYFCGNSLGLQAKTTSDDVQQIISDWADLAVKGHSKASIPWMEYQDTLKSGMAGIIGANTDEVAIGNALTVNLHFMMASFFRPDKSRYKILFENKCFPSDRYVMTSQLKFHGYDAEEGMVEVTSENDNYLLETKDFLREIEKNKDQLALMLLGGINYYTGQLYDLPVIVSKASHYGIPVGLDLAHVAGNVPINLHELEVDFACWCTYKYLNGGPGSLSGFFVNEKHLTNPDLVRLEGWWGNRLSSRFEMRKKIDPWDTAEKWIVSNPPLLAMAPLRSSMKLFEEAGMNALRKKSITLTAYLEYLIRSLDSESIRVITPSDPRQRGCQLSILVKSTNSKIYKQLTDCGIIVDWREPGVIRIAPVPMYNSFSDVYRFYKVLKSLL